MIACKPIAHAAVLTDQAGRIVTWNAASEQMFGAPAKQVLGKPLASLLTPDAGNECRERWPQLPTQAEALQVHIAHANGHSVGAALTLIPQVDAQAQPAGCVAIFRTLQQRGQTDAMIVGQTPLANIVNALAGTFYVLNRAGQFVLWNRKLERVAEMTPEELSKANALDMFREPERAMVAEKIRRVFEHGDEVVVDVDYISKSGKVTPYLICGTRGACAGVYYLCGMGLDTSERHEREAQLRLRDRALRATSNGIMIARCGGRDNPIEFVNPAFERISGYSEAEALGRDARFMAAPGLDLEERRHLREAILARRPVRVVLRNRRKDGEIFWNDLAITPVQDDAGKVSHFIGVLNDVTVEQQRTAALEHEVNHDPLTGLANRTLMWDRLEQALHFAQRNHSMVAAVLIDLDGFKQINDTLGHEAGDEVLIAVGRRLQSAVRDIDTVARLSGDEFVLILTNQPSLRFTLGMVERLRACLEAPVPFEGTDITVGASMGVSLFPNDGATAFELVRAADAAMYHAKAAGKRSVHFYSEDMKSATEARQRTEGSLRAALDNDELFLLYQPRFCMRSGRVVAVEALLRWRHPEHGVVLPDEFLGDAEENGMIIPIGQRVLELSCALLRDLRERGLPAVTVSINASYREFSQQHYIEQVASQLEHYDLPAHRLELELTEDHLMRNLSLSGALASQMKELGMGLAIDGFGNGITSLSYLHTHQVDHVKLNRNAVRGLESNPSQGDLTRTLIDIGHNMHTGVVAQGVETAGQLDFLRIHGCDEIQGHLVSDPLCRDALQRLLSGSAMA